MNKRLLFITCHKLCDNNGGANGSKGFIHCFTSLFDDCSLIYPEFDNTAAYIPAAYKLFPCHDSRSKIQKGFDMYRGVVGSLWKCVKEHLKKYSYDVIVIDHSVTGTSLVRTIKATGAKIITIHHNVERDYLRDNGKERPITYRFPYNYYAKKAELDCLTLSDVNLTVTENDAATFRSWFSGEDIHIYNWGIFEYKHFADKVFAPSEQGHTFIITGSLCFIQSLQPIIDFIRNYWRIVKEVCPDSKLIIAGRDPDKTLIMECEEKKDIRLVANPKDMTELLQKANYYICPIYTGSGCKLRIMDGMKQGLPVLCHEVSSSGYECMIEKACMYTYRDEKTFRHSLQEMLNNPIEKEVVYHEFRNNYNIEVGCKKLRYILAKEHII